MKKKLALLLGMLGVVLVVPFYMSRFPNKKVGINEVKADSAIAHAFFVIDGLPTDSDRIVTLKLDVAGQRIGFESFEIVFDASKINLSSEVETDNDAQMTTVVHKSTAAEANASGKIKLDLGLRAPKPNEVVRKYAPTGVFNVAKFKIKPINGGGYFGQIDINSKNYEISNLAGSQLVLVATPLDLK